MPEMKGEDATFLMRNIEKERSGVRTNIIAVSGRSEEEINFEIFDKFCTYYY